MTPGGIASIAQEDGSSQKYWHDFVPQEQRMGNGEASGMSWGNPLPRDLESTSDRTANSSDGTRDGEAPDDFFGHPLPVELESTFDWTADSGDDREAARE